MPSFLEYVPHKEKELRGFKLLESRVERLENFLVYKKANGEYSMSNGGMQKEFQWSEKIRYGAVSYLVETKPEEYRKIKNGIEIIQELNTQTNLGVEL